MTAAKQFEKDEADREFIRDNLSFLDTAFSSNTTTALTLVQVERYLQQAQDLDREVESNHNQLRRHAAGTTDFAPYTQDFFVLRALASRLINGFHGLKAAFPPPKTTRTPSSSSTAPPPPPPPQTIRLPPLELQKFSGNLQDWVPFRDQFITAVHSSSLSNVEKLTHLKSLLTGEASRQVRSLVLCDANYDIAWKALQERYENNRELLFSILKRLINQPPVKGSSSSIKDLIDTTKECVRSLEILSIPTQHWDAILLFLLFSKLDPTSRELWEQSLNDTSIPPLNRMYEFLEQRARALAASNVPAPRPPPTKPQQQMVRNHHVAASNCKFGCNSSHLYFKCPVFNGKTSSQRLDTVKKLNLCVNCIQDGHSSSSCPSDKRCKICTKTHHTMLHLDGRSHHNQSSTDGKDSSSSSGVQNHHISHGGLSTGILATARVNIITPFGSQLRRSLVDGGSTNSFITERTARQLRLPLRSCNIPMTGLSAASVGSAKYVTSFSFTSHSNSLVSYSATALVVKSITTVPFEKLQKDKWTHLEHLELADPDFHLPASCDILLGTDVFWSILENEKIAGAAGEPFAVKSSLGWLVAGPNSTATPVTIFNTSVDLDFQLRRFWEQETVPDGPIISTEEAACEEYYSSTYKRDDNGRFTVSLPFKNNSKEDLGSSRQSAVKRFISMEKRFSNPTTKDLESLRCLQSQWSLYKEFMKEYEDLGHMQLVPADEINSEKTTYYIPHHSVLKESSTTTKLRVVFDASATTTTGISLNQCLMVGPQLQDPITDIMLRFRTHPIAFTADVTKMYRQIRVTQEDTDFQRIVWREHPSLPLRDYRLLTVTYGTSSAPYLAIKTLQQLAKDEESSYPDAAKVALRDFYVDDTASGCDTLETAKKTVHQLMDLCAAGGMELRKWTTNSSELLSSIPNHLRETNPLVELQTDATVKTLGVYWNTTQDTYLFRLTLPVAIPGSYTKRMILSEIARIYDPLGWLAPVIISCKIYMQELWKVQLGWDEILPSTLQDNWITLRTSLADLEKLNIPRCVISAPPSRLILIGCSDASIKALSASVYIACEYEDKQSTCYLLTSKTKVAPVKHVTLPRLELNAAVLLADLLRLVIKALQLNFASVRAFTDSMITLHWIKSSPLRWKTFVRRRVQAIQNNVPEAEWFHISGEQNPADCASRGIPAAELLQHPLWWTGSPEFFSISPSPTDLHQEEISHLQAESQVIQLHQLKVSPLPPLYSKFSSFRRFVRVMAYIWRFIRKARLIPNPSGPLTVEELTSSHNNIIRFLQQAVFIVEYEILTKKLSLPTSNSLVKLQPFISNDGLIRVGGRLRNANMAFDQKHPILLPRKTQITTSIIWDCHTALLHAGPSSVLATLQQRYWITNGRDSVRDVTRRCVKCARHKAALMKQVMGDLPAHRITPSRPFSKVGVDYAGPISLRPMIRSKVTLKCWISIFICFTTHAIHLEVVSSLSTDCFIAALKRFVSRRGKPTDIFSDCGTNFKGADKILQDFSSTSQQQAIHDECSSQSITWHFSPAGAPHFGGLWEAGVKSMKYHLRRIMGSSHLTYEEMHTLVTQIEGILNSRPLVPASSDPSDLGVLTPAHFLIGAPITAIPEPNLMDERESHLKRWELLQQRQQLFWKRWSSEYLSRLQQRPKWWTPSPNLEIGHLVLIKDERLPPLKWKMGRVIAVHPGDDKRVRVATLRTSDGDVKRPIVKLSLLPIPIHHSEN